MNQIIEEFQKIDGYEITSSSGRRERIVMSLGLDKDRGVILDATGDNDTWDTVLKQSVKVGMPR